MDEPRNSVNCEHRSVLLLVVFAEKVGYSSAFGAFMMGSILAETVEAEQIERVVSPVKDLLVPFSLCRWACWSTLPYWWLIGCPL